MRLDRGLIARRSAGAAARPALSAPWALGGGAVILAALAVEYGAQFARSIALTRNLAPSEFGLAASMAILLTLVDMGTGVGADRYLVQAKDGGSVDALAVAHALTLGRGLLNACLVLLLAAPTAAVLHAPEQAGAYAWLAVVPVVRAFEHLWPEQIQRAHRFRRWAAASVTSSLGGLAAVSLAAWVLHDHRAVVWGLAAQGLALVAATHALAAVPYRLSFAGPAMARALRFGLPLMVNGLALAAMAQLDRLLVGSLLGLAQLGRYGLAAMLFYLPTSLLLRAMVSVLQPRLSASWHEAPATLFPRLYRSVARLMTLAASGAAAGVCIAGDPLVCLIFGRAYAVGDGFFCVFSLAVYMRFAKNAVNLAGLSMGRTRALMQSNLFGVSGLAVTAAGLLLHPALVMAALGAAVCETAGTLAAYAQLGRDLRADGGGHRAPLALGLALPVLSAGWVLLAHPAPWPRLAALSALGLAALGCLAAGPCLVRQGTGR